jgi:hypothetical protein
MILQKTPWVFCWAALGCALPNWAEPERREGGKKMGCAQGEGEEASPFIFFWFSFPILNQTQN